MNKLGLIELNDSLADIQNKCDLLGYQTIHFNYFHFTSQLFSVREENQFLCLKDEIETFIFNKKIDILLVDSEILLMLPAYIKKQIKLLFFKVPVIIVVTEIIKALENILMDLNPSDILFHYQSLNDFDFRLKTAFQRSNALNHFYAEHVELIETKNKLSVVNKQLEETIEHSNRLALVAELAKITQANFLSNMSHEMRTPLNGLLGITHLLAQTALNNEQKEYVELINTSSENLLTLISDILDYSRIDAGKMNLRIEEFSINEKIVKMLKTLTVKAYQKGLELIYEQDPTLPEIIRGDYSRINQILINLVGNAIKFTEKGEIKVSIRQKKIVNEHHRVLEFMVQDSGVGISEDNLDNIFEAFYQVEERTTKRYAGTGLGLAICKQLVSLMNGSIWVESEPGTGSTFWFSVHVDVPQQKAENEYDKEISGHKHVLIVDDSAGVRKYLRNILVASKMTADTAENEEECQRFLEHSEKNHRPYDLALIDLTLKDSDGWNIIKMIHNNPLNKDCKVIIITGLNEYNVSEYAKEAGAEAVLKKPVSRDELISTIQSVFAQNVDKNEKVSGRCAISAEQMALADEKTNQPSIEMSQKKLNILLVEDEAINRKFAERLLSREGHQITIAVNGLEAIEKYANDVFDVILMDVQMPEMNGIEATKRIREIENVKNIHTPVIALTAYSLPEELDKCLQEGMDDVITKPINVKIIMKKLSELVHQPQNEDVSDMKDSVNINTKNVPFYRHFNQMELIEQQCHDKEFMIELIEMFFFVLPEYMSHIKEAIAEDNPEQLNKSAHTLKGTLKTLRVTYCDQLAQELEMKGKEKQLSNALNVFKNLEQHIFLLKDELQHFLDMLKSDKELI